MSLARCRERFGFRLVAWVVMPDHVHLILVPDPRREPMAAILRSLKQPVAQGLIKAWRGSSSPMLKDLATPRGEVRVWQEGGGFDRNSRSPEELADEIEYIHQNPVKAGLVGAPTDWAWSSARWYAGQREGAIPIDPTGVHWAVKSYT